MRLQQGRLEGVTLTGREVAHLLGNELTSTVATFDLLQHHPQVPADLRRIVDQASIHLDLAVQHLQRLQQVVRVETRQTPVGPALDLERSAPPDGGE